MYKKMLLLTSLFCITTSPLFAGDEIDFYSKIDDAGNEIADAITTRHLKEYKNFRGFGKRCRGEAPWLDSEKISENDLRDIQQNNYSYLTTLAEKKKQSLDINDINTIATCLKTTYGEMQQESVRQQDQISTAGAYGIYTDGSLKNSDYDIIDDINKINKIIFTQPPKYNGPANANQKSLLDFLNGKEAKELEDGSGNTKANNPNSTTTTQIDTTITTPTVSDGDGNTLPWEAQCSDPSAGGGSATNPNLPTNLVDGNFTTDLSSTITQGNNPQNGGIDNSQNGNGNSQSSTQSKSNEDFFNKVPCNKMFCITIDFITNTKSGGGGGNDKSIESMLDKHIKMMEPISRSDLSAQKMTNNSFQLPFLNIKIANKLAGARVYMHNKPQKVKKLKTEDTEEKRKSTFDEAYRCALLDAGLQPDEKKNAGVQGAGYSLIRGQTLSDVSNSEKTLSPQDPVSVTKNPDISTKCAYLKNQISRQKREVVFVGNLNEFYSFTEAMNDIIVQILDSEQTKLDGLPTR